MIALSRFSEGGLIVSIPPQFKVVSRPPQFQATRKSSSITIVLNPAGTLWAGWQRMLHGPLGQNPDLDSRVVREGDIEAPYSGFERIVEHYCKPTGKSNFAWALLLQAGSVQVIFQIVDFGTFDESHAMWTQVVQSLHVACE
jgi:hypothetical protein